MRNYLTYIYTLLVLFAASFAAEAYDGHPRKDTVQYSNEYLDTVQVKRKLVINDYVTIGFQYGTGMHRMRFSPTMEQKPFFVPGYYGVSFTKYCKMFGRYPFFGYQLGLFYGHEGYKFKENKETGAISTINGATQAIYDIVEVPFLALFHYDMSYFKLMANVGPYAGYRLKIERFGEYVTEELKNEFADYERRFDYGVEAGVGFALVFAPVEFQINAMARYSWGTIYDPDYKSADFYRYGYPFDIMLTAGVYFQIGKRTGKTSKVLKNEARKIVYGED